VDIVGHSQLRQRPTDADYGDRTWGVTGKI